MDEVLQKNPLEALPGDRDRVRRYRVNSFFIINSLFSVHLGTTHSISKSNCAAIVAVVPAGS